ncbi:MAG: SUMF1/EgtB/PvdO family nonheme iron enzyme [Gammaproteobacteria bacterium]|nr:SUMF1/EgtB/PvdO family nonheme iron enzyme [Gammaproteobacteria bacterium]
MKRFIEIDDDQNELKQLTTDELPFEVSIQSNSEKNNHLFISKINSDDKTEKQIYAYIAEDEGHIFFQPAVEKFNSNETQIFHNDEVIDRSVWLKSGDNLQIEDKIITYNVSGDKIQIKVEEKTSIENNKIPKLVPPPLQSNQLNEKKVDVLPIINTQDNPKSINNKTKKLLLIGLSLILLLMACFVLFAETIIIRTEPMADEIELSGLFPTLKINNRFLLIKGKYDLTINKKNYKTINNSLAIDTNNNEFSYVLKEKPGIIEFNINPKMNNTLYIDNVLLGNDSNLNEELSYEIKKGQHTLLIENPRYKKFEQVIKVEGKNKRQNFKFELEPNWGYATITSETENVLVEIYSKTDNTKLIYSNKDQSKLSDIELISGDYQLKVSKEKYKEIIKNIKIVSGETLNLNIEKLIPKDGKLNISSNPIGSLLRINGKYIGKTPQSILLSSYTDHEIQLSLTGYKDLNKTIQLEAEETQEQLFELKTEKGLVFISVTPTQAELIIDGRKQKESSGKFNLSGKTHRLTVKAKGYETQTKTINASSYSKNISFNLSKTKPKAIIIKKVTSQPSLKKTNTLEKNKSNYTNSINQTMILVKPASFIMGSKKNEAGRGSNERAHTVKITRAYYMSDKEVSNKQFKQYKASHNSGMKVLSLDTPNQPIVNVSWNEAAKFSNWLSKKEGLPPYYKEVNQQMVPINLSGNNTGYRLPFEAEWALAAKSNSQNKYPWIGSFPPLNKSGNFADESARSYVANVIEGYNDSYGVSAPIGTFTKNNAGFYDLGGNVSEWCQDYYSPNYGLPISSFSKNKQAINPTGPKKGTHKVVRDSSWRDASITELRLSYRSYSKKKAKDIGFRLARSAP